MAQLVDLKVGFSCNNDCIHCVISDKVHEKDLSFQEIQNLIQEFIDKYGEIQLTLTGGEITIRKDFFDIMSFIKKKKDENKIVFVDMQTNGRWLSFEDRAKSASEVVDFFLIALHSNKPEIHDSITRSKGSFEQTTQGIRNVVNYAGKDKIAIQTVINSVNISCLKDIYRYVNEEFGIKECNITFPHPIGICQSRDVVPSYKEAQQPVNDALNYCLDNEIYPYIEALPFCVFTNYRNYKYAKDFLTRRNIDVVGYGGEKDGQLDYAALFDEGHDKYENCKQCPFYNTCEGVWKEHKWIYPEDNMFSLLVEEAKTWQ